MTFSSCGSDLLEPVLQILGNLLMGQQGQTYNFTGKGTMQVLKANGESFTYATENLAFQGTLPLTVSNSTGKLVLPAMDLNGYNMSGITFSNLALQAVGNEYTTIELGDNTMADGTLTVGSTSYPVSNLFIKAQATNTTLAISQMSIYFGEKGEYAVNVVFNGTNAAQ